MSQASSHPYRNLAPGDPAPWFRQRCTSNPNYAFDTVAGRYILLCFYGSAGDEVGDAALKAIWAHRDLFDDTRISCFGVSMDAADEVQGRAREMLPGLRQFWDFDGKIGRLYGTLPLDAPLEGSRMPVRRMVASSWGRYSIRICA